MKRHLHKQMWHSNREAKNGQNVKFPLIFLMLEVICKILLLHGDASVAIA
jgi:hypothetical protein